MMLFFLSIVGRSRKTFQMWVVNESETVMTNKRFAFTHKTLYLILVFKIQIVGYKLGSQNKLMGKYSITKKKYLTKWCNIWG